MHCTCPLRWHSLLLARAIVTAITIVVSFGHQNDGLNHSFRRINNVLTHPKRLGPGKNHRGQNTSSLEHRFLPAFVRELHSKSAKSKSSKSKSSKSKSSKIRAKSESSSSFSTKGSKSFASTSKSGTSKSAKGTDKKIAKEASITNTFDTDTFGSEDTNINLELPTEYEVFIPEPNYSAQESTMPNSEHTTGKTTESAGSDSDGATSSSSSSVDDATTEERSGDSEPSNLEADLTMEVRIAEGDSQFMDCDEMRDNVGANEELVENEAILDFSSESLE